MWMKLSIGLLLVGQLAANSNGVQPTCAAPVAWKDIESTVQRFITSGYTQLTSAWSDVAPIPDQYLRQVRELVFGSKKPLDAQATASLKIAGKKSVLELPATLSTAIEKLTVYSNQNTLPELYGGYNYNYPTVSGCYLSGIFEPRDEALKIGIKKGNFNNLLYWRLLVSEYLVGRICAAVAGFATSPIFAYKYTDSSLNQKTDQDIAAEFLVAAKSSLLQLRYLRSALNDPYTGAMVQKTSKAAATTTTPASAKGYLASSNATQSVQVTAPTVVRPVDTFAGVIVINKCNQANITLVNEKQENPIIPIKAAKSGDKVAALFSSGEYLNGWTADKDRGIGSARCVKFATLYGTADYWVAVAQDADGRLTIKAGIPLDPLNPVDVTIDPFDGKSFDSVLIKSFFSECAPWAVVVATTETATDQGTFLGGAIVGLVKLNQLDPAFDFAIKGDLKNGSKDYLLADLWNIPQKLYKKTCFPENDVVKPYAYSFLQGIYNGYLQTDKFQQLVPEVKSLTDYAKDPAKPSTYDVTKDQMIYMCDRWNTPSVEQWLAPDSPLDWKFLRTLIVTYNAATFLHITNLAFEIADLSASDRMTYLENIMLNPTNDIDACFYLGNQFDVTKKVYTYTSVAPYLPYVQLQKDVAAKKIADQKAAQDAAAKKAADDAAKKKADEDAALKKAADDAAKKAADEQAALIEMFRKSVEDAAKKAAEEKAAEEKIAQDAAAKKAAEDAAKKKADENAAVALATENGKQEQNVQQEGNTNNSNKPVENADQQSQMQQNDVITRDNDLDLSDSLQAWLDSLGLGSTDNSSGDSQDQQISSKPLPSDSVNNSNSVNNSGSNNTAPNSQSQVQQNSVISTPENKNVSVESNFSAPKTSTLKKKSSNSSTTNVSAASSVINSTSGSTTGSQFSSPVKKVITIRKPASIKSTTSTIKATVRKTKTKI